MKKTNAKGIRQINIRNVVIARGSRSELKKIKDCLFGSVLDAIECGNWWIPFSSYEYVDIKKHLETEAFHKFFKLPKSMKMSVKSFDTDMLSFERGH